MNSHKAIISLGSNNDAERSLHDMASLFRVWVKDVKASPTLTSPAIGMRENTPDFTNQILELETTLTATELNALCKKAEFICGNTQEQRMHGIIRADADLLLCDKTRYHEKDWSHGYIKQLLKYFGCTVLCFAFTATTCHAKASTHPESLHQRDMHATFVNQTIMHRAAGGSSQSNKTSLEASKEELARAIEYFGSQKYHEALLLFVKLDKKHNLSPRLKAYKGVCQFKETEYESAIQTLAPIIHELEEYPPHERAIYNYSCGESLFQLGRYTEAIPYFKKAYDVALDNDKAELCYRMGFSEMQNGNEAEAIRWFSEAEELYPRAILDDTTTAHKEQNKRMLRFLLAKTKKQ